MPASAAPAPVPSARYDLSTTLAAPVDLATLMQALAAVPSRRGRFVEEKRFAALDGPLLARGTLDYRPGHFEKHTTDPVDERLTVDGDRLTVAVAGSAERRMLLSAEPALQALADTVLGVLSGDLAALRRHYRVMAEGTDKSWRVTLTPLDPHLRGLLATVRIDGVGATPLVFETVGANGDSQRMTVTPSDAPAG